MNIGKQCNTKTTESLKCTKGESEIVTNRILSTDIINIFLQLLYHNLHNRCHIKDDRKGLLYKIQWHNRHFNRLSNLWILLLHQRNLQARIKRLRFHGRKIKKGKTKISKINENWKGWVPE